jgi:hypothetical protein
VHDLGPGLAAGEHQEQAPVGQGGDGGEGGKGRLVAVGILVQEAPVEVGGDQQWLRQS